MAYKVWYDTEMRDWIDQINRHTWLNVKYNEMQLESARETTAQLRDIADLEEALSKHEESNELLRDMGVQFESFNSELQNQSESLSRVEAAVNNINTSIKEQTGEIHAMRSKIEALRLDQAYQSFAMWRQSHDGLIYQAWAENANKWLSTVQRYMKSIDSAYAQDLQSHVARVLNKHAGELTIENYYHPRTVQKPQKPEKVSEDEAFQDHLDGLRYAVIFAGIISSVAIWISTTLNTGLFSNFWRTTLNLSFVFFLPVAVFWVDDVWVAQI